MHFIKLDSSHLIHCQISVVEIARAPLEADFRHAIVHEEEIPQLDYKHIAKTLYNLILY